MQIKKNDTNINSSSFRSKNDLTNVRSKLTTVRSKLTKLALWEGIKDSNGVVDKIKSINKSQEPLNKIVTKIIPYLDEFIESPILINKSINWEILYMSTIESILTLCIDSFKKREEKEKDHKSIEKLFINCFRTIDNDY